MFKKVSDDNKTTTSWCTGEPLSTIRLQLAMECEKLGAAFMFLLVLEDCWMLCLVAHTR